MTQPSTLQMEPDARITAYADRYQSQQAQSQQQNGASDDALDLTPAQRQAVMRRAYAAYRGKLPKPLKLGKTGVDLNLRVNKCRPYVRTFVDLLFGKPLTLKVMLPGVTDAESELPGGGLQSVPAAENANGDAPQAPAQPPATDAEDTAIEAGITPAEQEALDDCLAANRQATLLKKLGTNGAIFGQAFVKLVADGVTHGGATYPRMVVIDPQLCTIETHPDDVEVVLAKNITWQGVDEKGKPVQRRQRFERTDVSATDTDLVTLYGQERWQIRNQTRNQAGMVSSGGNPNAGWQDVGAPEPWPYNWCPLDDCQNLPEPCSYWGAPDLETDLVELNFALNFALSNTHTVGYYYGNPKMWGKGFRRHELEWGPGEMPILQNPNAEITMLQMQGDLVTALRDFTGDIRNHMDEMVGLPGFMQGRMADVPRGQMSGVALEMYAQSPLQRTYDKRELYGDLLKRLCSHALEMMGHGEGLDVEIDWPTILPRDMAQFAQVAPILQGIGISDGTLIREAGYDPDQEAAAKAREDAQHLSVGQAVMQTFNASGPPAADPNNPYGGMQPPMHQAAQPVASAAATAGANGG